MSQIAVNGVKINVERQGSGSPMVLLHGFTGSAASWQEVAAGFAARYEVITLDALGHGLSSAPSNPNRYTMPYVASDFVAVLDALNLDKVTLLGYSMGGRMALHIATVAPQRISKLVLESATPGISDEYARTNRRQHDEQLAQMLEKLGLEKFVDFWEKQELFDSQVNLPVSRYEAQHQLRLQNNPVGLANSLRGAGTGAQAPLWDKLAALDLKIMLIVGDLDQKFVKIGQEMLQLLSNAIMVVWPNCGHTVHLESPDMFVKAVSKFLRI